MLVSAYLTQACQQKWLGPCKGQLNGPSTNLLYSCQNMCMVFLSNIKFSWLLASNVTCWLLLVSPVWLGAAFLSWLEKVVIVLLFLSVFSGILIYVWLLAQWKFNSNIIKLIKLSRICFYQLWVDLLQIYMCRQYGAPPGWLIPSFGSCFCIMYRFIYIFILANLF